MSYFSKHNKKKNYEENVLILVLKEKQANPFPDMFKPYNGSSKKNFHPFLKHINESSKKKIKNHASLFLFFSKVSCRKINAEKGENR